MRYILLLLFFFLHALQTTAKPLKGYSISGKIVGIPDETIFYLIKTSQKGGADTLQMVKSDKSGFLFEGSVLLEGELHFIKMDTSKAKIKRGKIPWIRLLLENSNVLITGTLEKWPEVEIAGSPITLAYEEFLKLNDSSRKEISKSFRLSNRDNNYLTELKEQYKSFITVYLETHEVNLATPLIVKSSSVLSLEEKTLYLKNMPYRIKNSFYGVQLSKQLKDLKQQKNVAIGKKIPNFKFETLDGNKLSINEVARQNELLLIDFWAYWCSPCRADIPNLKKAFYEFKDLGFNIISISTDPNTTAWKKAVIEENVPWKNGMEIDNASKNIFLLSAIPGYILVNKESEIVAMDITRTNSENEVLQYMINGKRKGLRGSDLQEVLQNILFKQK